MLPSSKFQAPPSFTFQSPPEWPTWRKRFKQFWLTTKFNKDDVEVHVNSLIYSFGPESEHIPKAFSFDTATKKRSTTLSVFNNYFEPKRNVTRELIRFGQRVQNPGESGSIHQTSV